MREEQKQHSERFDVRAVRQVMRHWPQSPEVSCLAEALAEIEYLEEQLETLRQAEEAAQTQERVGNEGDADAIRRDAIKRVLGLGLYAASSPASEPGATDG